MDDRLKDIIDDKAITDGSCGGFRRCTHRVCNPIEPDCQECIEDYENAIKEKYKGD